MVKICAQSVQMKSAIHTVDIMSDFETGQEVRRSLCQRQRELYSSAQVIRLGTCRSHRPVSLFKAVLELVEQCHAIYADET